MGKRGDVDIDDKNILTFVAATAFNLISELLKTRGLWITFYWGVYTTSDVIYYISVMLTLAYEQ